jgi:hypothetical protein
MGDPHGTIALLNPEDDVSTTLAVHELPFIKGKELSSDQNLPGNEYYAIDDSLHAISPEDPPVTSMVSHDYSSLQSQLSAEHRGQGTGTPNSTFH